MRKETIQCQQIFLKSPATFLIIGKCMKTWLEIDNKLVMDNAHWNERNEKSWSTRIFLNG